MLAVNQTVDATSIDFNNFNRDGPASLTDSPFSLLGPTRKRRMGLTQESELALLKNN